MKREYRRPVARYIDYTYNEQVVASSNKVDGKGDGFEINYCTYTSDKIGDGCTRIVGSTYPTICLDIQEWALR